MEVGYLHRVIINSRRKRVVGIPVKILLKTPEESLGLSDGKQPMS